MKNLKQHIVFRIFCLLITAVFLIPTAVKLAHAFSHHEHKVCKGNVTTHIHEIDLDCEFQKFQFQNQFFSVVNYDGVIISNNAQNLITLTYKFLNNHRQLSFSLRGPPRQA